MEKRILIIDDNKDVLESTKIVLEEYTGYKCFAFTRADDIFEKVRNIKPDLIILDILLSGEDGRDICLSLKNNSEFASIPVILFSAQNFNIESLKPYKVNDFIEKPFDLDHLFNILDKHLL